MCDLAGNKRFTEFAHSFVAVTGHDVTIVKATEGEVDVAGVAFAFVELRHEGERLALLRCDIFRAHFVDDVVIAGAESIAILKGNFVLSEIALALC